MVGSSIFRLYETTIFLAQLRMNASDHLFNKCDQEIRQVKIQAQILEEKLKQLCLWLHCFFEWLLRVVPADLQVPNEL